MIDDVKETYFPRLDQISPAGREKILAAVRALDATAGSSFRELFTAGKVEDLDRCWLESLQIPPEDANIILQELRAFFQTIFDRF